MRTPPTAPPLWSAVVGDLARPDTALAALVSSVLYDRGPYAGGGAEFALRFVAAFLLLKNMLSL